MKPNEQAEVDKLLTSLVDNDNIRYITDFCSRMFAAVYNERSNSRRLRLFYVFQNAVERVALFAADYSPADIFAKLVARSDFTDDTVDATRFRDQIAFAFARSEFSQFKELREALEHEQQEESLRNIARLVQPLTRVVMDDEMKRFLKQPCPTRSRRR
jgi:hypothetical protein